MTSNRIKKELEKNGISIEGLEIRKDEIEICIGYTEENGFGSCDEDKVEERFKQIAKVLPRFSAGYSTQYDALILPIDYKVGKLDWNDTSSPMHY